MSDIYATVNGQTPTENTDKIEERNEYPENQPEEKQRPSNPGGRVNPSTVDYFQLHPLEGQFNDPTGLLSVYDPDP